MKNPKTIGFVVYDQRIIEALAKQAQNNHRSLTGELNSIISEYFGIENVMFPSRYRK